MTTRLTIPIFAACALTLALTTSSLNAQGSGGGSGGAGGGGASSGVGGAGAAGSAAARRSGGGTTSPGSPSQATPNPALNSNPALKGQTATPTPDTGSGQAATPGAAGAKGDGNTAEQGSVGTRATNRGNMPDPTPNSQTQANSPNDQSRGTRDQALTGGGSARREGASGHDMQTCMATWDKGTHITKARWRQICARTLREQEAVRRQAENYNPNRR
jgi:hypothetical protein